jgi:Ca-activated chloride channel family protein
MPDLFAGTQLVIAGRYREGGPATITLTGEANGRPQTFAYADQLFRDEGGEAFIPRLWATRAIGHLMQQIRLRGENDELVQSIVNLSARYGVITPYTSFLIEEDDIGAQTDGAPPMEAAEMLAAPAMASGAEAVDRAAAESQLFLAEAPAPLATMAVTDASGQVIAQAAVQSVGSRTFFLRNGVWVDSAYDSVSSGVAVEPQVVPFASDAYFDLLSDRPELGEALALGEEIILVIDGAAVRITAQGGEQQTTDEATPVAQRPTLNDEPLSINNQPSSATNAGIQVCGLGLILPLVVLAGWGASRRKRRNL